MKKLFIFILTMLLLESSQCQQTQAEKIDTSNYYENFPQYVGYAFLKGFEVIPVMVEELNNAGITDVSTSALMKLENGTYLVLSVYSHSSKFGFVYEEMFSIPFSRKDRDFLSDPNGTVN